MLSQNGKTTAHVRQLLVKKDLVQSDALVELAALCKLEVTNANYRVTVDNEPSYVYRKARKQWPPFTRQDELKNL